ncbi:MAG: RNA-binding domain-containing protein [Thermoplasmatales archaeon]|nr:RNA-binding domain-containing protein [Thermoplasmatales archaeon]
MKVVVETICKPTEDKDKIKKAVLNIFPELRIDDKGNRMTGASSSLDRFKEILRNHRIRDTARTILLRGEKGNKTIFKLNKQVAFVGKICFAEESHPLGDIWVTIEGENIDSIIEEITSIKGEEK